VGISEEVEHRTLAVLPAPLGVCPGTHDCTIVDADDDDLVDSLGLERLLRFEVPGNLTRRSGRRESPWKAHDDTFLPGEAGSNIDIFGRTKSGVDRQLGELDTSEGRNERRR
jgi:hypothetical protein